jgi:hypothetical protein
MKKIKPVIIIVVILLIILSISYFSLNYTREGNALIATNFVKNEATYKFDGIPDTFELNQTVAMECPYCWEFYFNYHSRNSGYGDRTDALTNPVITNHTAIIIVEKGTINSAVLDGVWDMKTQGQLSDAVPLQRLSKRR